MKVFGAGAYTIGNRGDAALVDAYLSWLRHDFGATDICLTSFTPALDAAHYGTDVLDMPIRPLSNVSQFTDRLAWKLGRRPRRALARLRLAWFNSVTAYLSRWTRLYRRSPRIAALLVPPRFVTVARAIDHSDLTIAVPGGYLNAPTDESDWWLFHLPSLVISRGLGKPIILSPCSIGPFTEMHMETARRHLALADAVMVREDTSLRICRELGVTSTQLIRTPDLAFTLGHTGGVPSPDWARAQLAGHGSPNLAISVRHHTFPASPDPAAARKLYLSAVARAVGHLVSAHAARPAIVLQTDEDRATSDDLAQLLRREGIDAPVVGAGMTPLEMCALYREFRLLIGTRMHANIFAMSGGTPVLAIGYEPKTAGILASMGLLDWYVAIENLTGLSEMADRLWLQAPDNRALAAERSALQVDELRLKTSNLRQILQSVQDRRPDQ